MECFCGVCNGFMGFVRLLKEDVGLVSIAQGFGMGLEDSDRILIPKGFAVVPQDIERIPEGLERRGRVSKHCDLGS